jgi:hypothetical protein
MNPPSRPVAQPVEQNAAFVPALRLLLGVSRKPTKKQKNGQMPAPHAPIVFAANPHGQGRAG